MTVSWRGHMMDWGTDYCVRCGKAASDLLDRNDRHCPEGVVAISHIVRGRRLSALLDKRAEASE